MEKLHSYKSIANKHHRFSQRPKVIKYEFEFTHNYTHLCVSICKNQAQWEKSEKCMSKPHRPDNAISLKDTFSI